jgi:ParB-like chromosome segregation protein Spo0J
MNLLREYIKELIIEQISSEELQAFDAKYKDSKNVGELAGELGSMGWDPKFIEHHKNEDPAYAEIRSVILKLDKYEPATKPETISAEDLYIDLETIQDREKKYQDFKSGKIDKYFRDDTRDPDDIDFGNLEPITAVEQPNGNLEVADGNHRAFLAKKNKADLTAWVIRLR